MQVRASHPGPEYKQMDLALRFQTDYEFCDPPRGAEHVFSIAIYMQISNYRQDLRVLKLRHSEQLLPPVHGLETLIFHCVLQCLGGVQACV